MGFKLYEKCELSVWSYGDPPPEHHGEKYIEITDEIIDAIADAIVKKMNKVELQSNVKEDLKCPRCGSRNIVLQSNGARCVDCGFSPFNYTRKP